MRRGYRVLPKTHFRPFTEVMPKAGASLRGGLASEVLFCFPALRFDVFSPYRDSRYCNAPKPGKEKQKSYDYRSAILMVHRFRSFLSVFIPVLRKIWREVTRKNPEDCLNPPSPTLRRGRPRIMRMSRIQERSTRRLGFRLASAAADALQLSSDLQQRGRALPDLSE